MIRLRPANQRGTTQIDWLESYHTFSFSDYHDPEWMGFKSLRVINEDIVKSGTGFGTHGHRDMEILTYILSGELKHEDSMGNGSIIKPGQIQRMSAGTGVKHSEFNHSKNNHVHLLQIWILPQRQGIKPGYEQKNINLDTMKREWHLIASPKSGPDSVLVHQSAEIFATSMKPGDSRAYTFKKGRAGWVQAARGSFKLNDVMCHAGDGAAIENETQIRFEAAELSEILLFDLKS